MDSTLPPARVPVPPKHWFHAISRFPHIILCDFEFCATGGKRPVPLCMVWHDVVTGERGRLDREALLSRKEAPFPVDDTTLFVAYMASAELGCFLALGWPMPVNVLDLYVEFRCSTNGRPVPSGNGLLGALPYHGISHTASFA